MSEKAGCHRNLGGRYTHSEQGQKGCWNGRREDTQQTQGGLGSSETADRKGQKSCIDRKASLSWFTQIPGHGHVTFCFAHLPLSLCLLVQKGPSPSSASPSPPPNGPPLSIPKKLTYFYHLGQCVSCLALLGLLAAYALVIPAPSELNISVSGCAGIWLRNFFSSCSSRRSQDGLSLGWTRCSRSGQRRAKSETPD